MRAESMILPQRARGVTVGTTGIFILASLLYLTGLCPTISWYDSPEFVAISHALDIGHPAGSPTYTLMTKLATFLPMGSVALRVNAASAFFAALTLTLVFRLIYGLCAGSSSRVQHCAAWSGALALMVSQSFWRFAEVAEVYILQNWFLVLLLLLLITARTSPPQRQHQWCWLFAFLYGLSAGVHATMALFVPAFLGFMALTMPRLWRSRALAYMGFFFLMGFATYSYLPLRSLTDPPFNWGEPQTWQQFWTHISDRKDSDVHTALFWEQLPYQLYRYGLHLIDEFSVLGVTVGSIGLLHSFRRAPALGWLLALAWLGHTAFFIRSWWDTAWGFVPSFVIFALWLGVGIRACLAALGTLYQRYTIRVPQAALSTLLLGGLFLSLTQGLLLHTPQAKKTDNYSTELYGKVLLEQLPPDAILFCEYSWFPLLYLQHVERQRPDLTFILQSAMLSPQYFALVSQQRFPNVQQVTSAQSMRISAEQYFWMFSKLNAQAHPLFWDPDAQFQTDFPEHLLPQGLLFALDPHQTLPLTAERLRRHWGMLAQATNRIVQGDLEEFTTTMLANKLNMIATYFRQKQLPRAAHTMLQAALALRPESQLTHNNYGAFLVTQGEYTRALEHYNLAYEQEPIGPLINKNIGALLARQGDMRQAAHFLERALAFGMTGGDVYTQLGEVYVALNRVAPALDMWRRALQQYQKQASGQEPDAKLQQKITLMQQWIRRLETEGQGSVPPR